MLGGVDARKVDFFKADLRMAGLSRGCFKETVFYEANLEKAVMKNADLEKANLTHAKLQGADLTGANLSQAILEKAQFDSTTKWPDNFDPLSKSAVLVE